MSSTDTIVVVLVMVLCISAVYSFGQLAIKDMNPDSTGFYNCNNGLLGSAGTIDCNSPNGSYVLSNRSDSKMLPNSEASTDNTGNIFTDTFVSAREWLLDSTGIGYIIDIVSAPYNIIKVITESGGLPSAFAVITGGIFYVVLIFLIVAWAMGR